LTWVNSTFSGNTAGFGGGGLFTNGATVLVRDSTITGNRSQDAHTGGGLSTTAGAVTLYNTLVAGNVHGAGTAPSDITGLRHGATRHDLTGAPGRAGGLVAAVNGNTVGDGRGNLLPIASILAPTLKYNGGPTMTHALTPNSPAINAGSNAQALDVDGVTPLL